jgi:hypothetical protein
LSGSVAVGLATPLGLVSISLAPVFTLPRQKSVAGALYAEYPVVPEQLTRLFTDVTDVSDEDSGATENYSQAVSTRLTPSTKERYDRFRDEHDLGNAQALRRLVRVALEQEQTDTRLDERETARRLAWPVVGLYIWFSVRGPREALAPTFGVFVVVIVVWSNWPHVQALRDWLS